MARVSRRNFVALGAGTVLVSGSGCVTPPPPSSVTDDVDAGSLATIGVLGGLGPQATMDFEQRVHRMAQRRIAPNRNGGYPPMVVHYCRHAPFLVDADGIPIPPLRPDPRLLLAAQRLGICADFLVATSNGVHLLAAELERASGRPLLSMITATLARASSLGWRHIGVLGLGEPTVYTAPLKELGVRCETIAPPLRARLDAAIFRIMEGRDLEEARSALDAAIAALVERRVDGVLLGCTELPVILGAEADDPRFLNPTQILAEAAVERSMGRASRSHGVTAAESASRTS